MAVDVDSFAMFDKRRNDPVFMEFLLKNHASIIDQKEGVDKILYSGEIARLLARVAIQGRCLADYEKRSRDEQKYNDYYKTSLFVIRKGIDIGVNLGYDAFEKGIEVPDVAYNHYMGWIYVHYSMILTETHRYFAAMSSIINAENFLIHDLSQVLTNNRLDIIIQRLKNIPEFENKAFNYSAKQLPEKVAEALLYLTGGLQDAILEKKVRILYKVYKEVPDRYRDLYAGYINSILVYFSNKDRDQYSKDFAEIIQTIQGEYPKPPEKYLDLPDLTLRDTNHKESIEEKEYALWVVSCDLALSYLDFVPDMKLRLQYLSDDLVFDLGTSELNIMMRDVMETFAHCRIQVFSATHYPNPMGELAYYLSPKAERIFNQELLLDVYPRLYSVLDKISHIVMKTFKIELPKREGSNYDPQPSYNSIVQEIRKNSNGNPYLLTLCEIFGEINPRFIYRTQKGHPYYAMLPNAVHMDKLRHHIIHSGVSLTVNDSGKASTTDIAYITEREFAHRCHDLLCLVKEAIMNTCLAIEYKNRQE